MTSFKIESRFLSIDNPSVSHILTIFNLSEVYSTDSLVTDSPIPSLALLFSGSNKLSLINVLFPTPALPITMKFICSIGLFSFMSNSFIILSVFDLKKIINLTQKFINSWVKFCILEVKDCLSWLFFSFSISNSFRNSLAIYFSISFLDSSTFLFSIIFCLASKAFFIFCTISCFLLFSLANWFIILNCWSNLEFNSLFNSWYLSNSFFLSSFSFSSASFCRILS